ncbi:hypothetical protein AAHH80_38110, partial [Burkholderia pseudomallei]
MDMIDVVVRANACFGEMFVRAVGVGVGMVAEVLFSFVVVVVVLFVVLVGFVVMCALSDLLW